MGRVLEHCWLTTGTIESRIQFGTEGGGSWPVWHRYLLLDGKRAYKIGNVCNTCTFFFERLDGANDRVQIDEAADALRSGIRTISDPIVSRIGTGLPPDEYLVCLLEIAPRLVQLGGAEDYFSQEQIQLWGLDTFWALPHDPRVLYYRAGTHDIGDHAGLFEFVVPMFPPLWLEKGITDRYRDLLAAASWPTAVSLSVLDIKAPANWEGDPRVTEHWCLVHYVLDGHHKLDAARLLRQGNRYE